MCESYARSLLRVSVAQICQALGWDAVQLTACDLLSDVLHRYIQQLAKGCHRYSELYGRTDPALDDVGQAFRLLGVSLSELEDYVNNLEPVSFAHQTPLFPVTKNNVLQFPQPGGRDADERKEYIPDYLPPLVSLQEEEEEEEVLPDMGTSAEAMQVPLDEEDDEMEEDEAVNDENHPLKRHLDSPDAAMGMMPTSKRPRMHPGLSPEWGVEPREPLTSLNPQRLPPGVLASHDSLGSLSPETPTGTPTSFRPLPAVPRHADHKSHSTPGRKPKGSSPGRQRTKSPKGVNSVALGGSTICSPKSSKERKKSPGRTKSPKSPKSPKISSSKTPLPLPLPQPQLQPQPPSKTDAVNKLPLLALNERMGKENIHMRQSVDDGELPDASFENLEPDDQSIDDSIDAVIAQACAEREPDPFAFSSGSESESNGFSSPRRLTIMEPATPKLFIGTPISSKDTSTPLQLNMGPGNWTMDDSINEVLRKVNQGGPSSAAPPQLNHEYMSSGSPSPPTPEPALLKALEEKNKVAPPGDLKKKLKKELKTKLKKKEKDKPKDKERAKLKEKSKEKSRDKGKEFAKEAKLPWKEFDVKDEDLFLHQRDFAVAEVTPAKIKSKDADGSGRKEKEKHKDKKKDKERSKKDKDKRDKGKDKGKEEKQKLSALAPFGLADMPPLFSAPACLRIPSMLPPLPPILQDKETKGKEKEKKKDKKEKKKKKDKEKEKEKEREKAKEKEREKEEKKKEKEREKEKREKEKVKERIRLEKVKVDIPACLPSPVIPRLTLRVGTGHDKIVISKVVPSAEPKTPVPKTPAPKSAPAARPRSPPPPPLPPIVVPPPMLPPISLLSAASSLKTPVRSVVTETVSTYVIRDECGNQIWICPGCNKPDDGSPMIGCDGCNDWYHWPCVGILAAPPEDQQWFCVKCASKKKDKKHKKRKHKLH
ncbi:Transcription initiation factor TFIID subunit 3 [Merluccius polli]|uniref:Transcription initiation factor TFIID subunit 3 n=1 Tax=Merluccius polli TaxID=89951 RepID=A0AA47MEX6_MERPO|nr:Transcription initiation factor TFIID subunit 3 [Merluccius polli]